MGRHTLPPPSRPASPGRRRLATGRRRRLAVGAVLLTMGLVATVVVVILGPGADRDGPAVTGAGKTLTAGQISASGPATCTAQAPLRVIAASAIAPVITAVARRNCIAVQVTVNDTGSGATQLAGGLADVWVPDSRARALPIGAAAGSAPSVASSPIVMLAGSSQDVSAVAPGGRTSWGLLLKRTSLSGLTFRIQDTTMSSVGLLVAAELRQLATAATGDQYLGLAATAAALNKLPDVDVTHLPSDGIQVLESRLVPKTDAAHVLTAAEGAPALDFPLITAPTLTGMAGGAATQLLHALLGADGSTARAAAGLLDPNATEFSENATTTALLPAPALATIPTLYALVDAGGLRGNDVSIVDVSGSMADPAGPGGPSKLDAVKASGSLALGFLSDETSMALWDFGYRLTPTTDYQQLAPLAPLSQGRAQLLAALNGASVQKTGTGLYSTVLAAYQYLQANWAADHVNAIVLFTDGKDEDAPGGPSLAQVTAQLQALKDPNRPIELLCFGYGDADIASMTALTTVTSGHVYQINQPAQIVGAFIDAIAQAVLTTSA